MNDTERIQQELVKADPSEELVRIFQDLGYISLMAFAYEAGREHERKRANNAEQDAMENVARLREAKNTIKELQQELEYAKSYRHNYEHATKLDREDYEALIKDLEQHAASQHETICTLRSMVDSLAQPCNGPTEASE